MYCRTCKTPRFGKQQANPKAEQPQPEAAAQMQEQKGVISKSWLQHDGSLKRRNDSSWEAGVTDGVDVQQCD